VFDFFFFDLLLCCFDIFTSFSVLSFLGEVISVCVCRHRQSPDRNILNRVRVTRARRCRPRFGVITRDPPQPPQLRQADVNSNSNRRAIITLHTSTRLASPLATRHDTSRHDSNPFSPSSPSLDSTTQHLPPLTRYRKLQLQPHIRESCETVPSRPRASPPYHRSTRVRQTPHPNTTPEHERAPYRRP
jgi:hypothetical protein